MRFVLDNSSVMRWLLNDRTVQAQDYAHAVLQLLANGDTAMVPNLWALEAANVLAKALKEGVISDANAREFVALLADLDIETDPTTSERALHDTLNLALQYDLSAYDAAYLELAFREGLSMATLDEALATAQTRAGGFRVLIS